MKSYVTGLLFGVFLTYLSLATAKEVVCGFPGTPAHGSVKPDQEAYKEGDVVSYTCRVGYILLGFPVSRCTEDGSWTEEVPICDDSMTTLGVAFSTPTVPGHPAEMAIDRDKDTCSYLKPKKPRWWRIDLGNTYKVLTVAVTMISSDKNVKFTIFVIKALEGSASYKRCASFSGKFGTQTVVLSCAEGKGIEGEKVHIEDHLQTEGLFEICEVEVQVEKNTGYDCGRPSRNLYSIAYTPRNGRVDYGCIRGFEIRGRGFRVCQRSGQWSDEPPVCDPVICDELDDLENGQIHLSHKNEQPLEGTEAEYTCDEGYKLTGSPVRVCQKDGSWNGKDPQCKAIRCLLPDGRDVGGVYRLVNKTTNMGSMALLRCKRGKQEGDNPYISCTAEGTWTKAEARCILPAGVSFIEPKIEHQGAIIFGMVVAAIMIVVVLVSMYLYLQKWNISMTRPELPSRFAQPPAPPPRPPKSGDFKSTLMGLISRDSDKPEDQKELQSSWKSPSYDAADHKGGPSVVEVEILAQDDQKRKVYPVPEENENTSLENVVLDLDNRSGSPKEDRSAASEYASVDYDKKRQSRLLKEQDSVDSSSTGAASPIPQDDSEKKGTHSPTPTKTETEEESEEDDEAETQRKAKEEEERKRKEEEEQKEKEEAEKKAKEEAEKKSKEEAEATAAPRTRRRIRDEPPPEEEKPVMRRFRRN